MIIASQNVIELLKKASRFFSGYQSLVPHHCLININDSELVTVLMEEGEMSSDEEGADERVAYFLADVWGVSPYEETAPGTETRQHLVTSKPNF